MRHRFPFALLLLLPLLAARHNTPPPTRPGGKDYALFFAVEQYDQSGSWKTLPGLIGECEAIRTDLVERFGFSTESKVVKNPTLKEIQDELARWRSKNYGPDDQLLVFFSGHGQFLDDVQEGFFIPKDGSPSSVASAERSWYSLLQLPRHVTTIPCRHVLLAIDACFSGTIDSRVALKNEDEEWAEPSTNAEERFNQYIHDRLAAKSRILMTSGGKNRTKHPSDFVKWFREGLSTLGGKDRIVYPGDIEKQWPASTMGRPLASTFEGHEAGGNFLFVYQPKATPKLVTPPLAAPDFDDDGVPDATDKCPTEPGPASTKGCPDTDRDGVADKFDHCDTEPGPASNDGCPETTEPVQSPTKPGFVDPMAASMVYLEGGTFQMGSNDFERSKPIHTVELSPFYISKYEVTIGQYLAFCEATNSHWPEWMEAGSAHHFQKGHYYTERGMSPSNTTHAITGVLWNDAVAFCNWLKEKTGRDYRLPTEAEWEYAARGGQKSRGYTYAGSNTPKDVAWNSDNAEGKVHPVGGLRANEAGLYDLSGNVWEWCADWYDDSYYASSPRKNPRGPSIGSSRVLRGGSWYHDNYSCQFNYRQDYVPGTRYHDVGFRVVRDK